MRWNLNMIIHEQNVKPSLAVWMNVSWWEFLRRARSRPLAVKMRRDTGSWTTEPQNRSQTVCHRSTDCWGPVLHASHSSCHEAHSSLRDIPPASAIHHRQLENRETLKITRSLITLTNITASFVHYWIVVKRWIHVHANIFTAHILLLMTWKFYICILNAQLNLGCKSSPRLFQRSPVSDSDGGQNLCMPLEHQATHGARVLAPLEMTRLYMWPV